VRPRLSESFKDVGGRVSLELEPEYKAIREAGQSKSLLQPRSRCLQPGYSTFYKLIMKYRYDVAFYFVQIININKSQ
jgi:hypothetical protein